MSPYRRRYTPKAPPHTLITALPLSVLLDIIDLLHHTHDDVAPFIKSCKKLYRRYWYMVSPVQVEELMNFRWIARNTFHHYQLQALSADPVMRLYTSSLKVNSEIPKMTYFNNGDVRLLSGLFMKLPKVLVDMKYLKTMVLQCNSPYMMFHILQFLPLNLENLQLRLDSYQDHLYSDEEMRTCGALAMYMNRRETTHLKQFEFHATHGRPILSNPEAAFKLVIRAVRSVRSNGLLQPLLSERHTRRFREKYNAMLLIGDVLYLIISAHSESLESVVFAGCDLDMVFRDHCKPFSFPSLKLFVFDAASDDFWYAWYYQFELANLQDNQEELATEHISPLVIYRPYLVGEWLDIATSIIHIKHISDQPPSDYTPDPDSPEMWSWRKTTANPLTFKLIFQSFKINKVF